MEANYTLELTQEELKKLVDILPSHSDPSHPLTQLEKLLATALRTEIDSGYCLDVAVTIIIVKE